MTTLLSVLRKRCDLSNKILEQANLFAAAGRHAKDLDALSGVAAREARRFAKIMGDHGRQIDAAFGNFKKIQVGLQSNATWKLLGEDLTKHSLGATVAEVSATLVESMSSMTRAVKNANPGSLLAGIQVPQSILENIELPGKAALMGEELTKLGRKITLPINTDVQNWAGLPRLTIPSIGKNMLGGLGKSIFDAVGSVEAFSPKAINSLGQSLKFQSGIQELLHREKYMWDWSAPPPSPPILERRDNGRPNYIEYSNELKQLPENGFWRFQTSMIRIQSGPGSFDGDMWLLSDDRIPREKRLPAARRFIRRYISPLAVRDPVARRAINQFLQEAPYSASELMEEVFPQMVLNAMDDCDQYQRVRFGKVWVKSKSGRVKLVQPVTLKGSELSHWVRQRVYQQWATMLRNEYALRSQDLRHYDAMPAPDMDALVAADSADPHLPNVGMIEDKLKTLPRVLRRYVRTLLNSVHQTGNMSEARKYTARSLRITDANERQLYKRMHRKFAQPPSKSQKAKQTK